MIRPWFRHAAVPWKTTVTQTRASGENRVSTKPGVLQGFTPSRLASSLPDQSWPGWLAMMRVTWSLLLSGRGWRGPGGWFVRRGRAGDRHGLAGTVLVTFLVADVVAGGGAFDLAGAVARAAGGQQAGKDGTADPAGVGWVCGVRDAAGCGDLVAGGLQRDGEAGPARTGSGGLGGSGHGHPQRLVEGQQRPEFLLGAGPVAGAEHVPAEQGVPQRQVGDLDFPALMVKADQLPGGVAAPVPQRGDQPVAVADPGPVRAVNI